jgi:hypothetical protein
MGNAKNIYSDEVEVLTLAVKLVLGGMAMGIGFAIGLTE